MNHYLNTSIQKSFDAFYDGFHKVIGGKALEMCYSQELELIICGQTFKDLDFKELEQVAHYDDGYDASHPLIQ
jgi:hypothetical protein